VVASEQVAKYLSKYGLVVVTNLRQFVIVARVQARRPSSKPSRLRPPKKHSGN
jgi:hypothetical protein